MMFFLLIFFLLSFSPITAQSFNYQLEIPNNSIELKLFEVIEESPITEEAGQFLSFDFQLSSENNLLPDLPLFLADLNGKVLFYADQSLADNQIHQVVLNTEGVWPIFYRNIFVNDFDLILNNFRFIDELPEREDFKISSLLAIKEIDQSLTILFSTESDLKETHSFELFCEDSGQSINLSKQDDFLWTDFNFQSFLKNHQHEFIFHLDPFSCDSNVYLLIDGISQSVSASIVDVKDL